jgi:hypothetical protein
MKKSSTIIVTAIALGVAVLMPHEASAQGVTVYVNPGYSGYGYYPPYYGYPAYSYPSYGYTYPSYGYSYPGYGYGYRPYYGTYWGQGRRVARRVNRRWDRWD